jgi:hypothetical protein
MFGFGNKPATRPVVLLSGVPDPVKTFAILYFIVKMLISRIPVVVQLVRWIIELMCLCRSPGRRCIRLCGTSSILQPKPFFCAAVKV